MTEQYITQDCCLDAAAMLEYNMNLPKRVCWNNMNHLTTRAGETMISKYTHYRHNATIHQYLKLVLYACTCKGRLKNNNWNESIM
jgi:hypothetical protein